MVSRIANLSIRGKLTLITMVVTAIINAKYQRDFAREWVESLRIKHNRPLGEEALARMSAGESKY